MILPPPPLVPAIQPPPPPPRLVHPSLYHDPEDLLSRREAEALVESLVAKKIAAMAEAGLIPVKQGDPGGPGPRGVTFTPHVSSTGVLSWTNDGGLPNPDPVLIKGLKGDPGTINAQTLASVNAALADFQSAYSRLSTAIASAEAAANTAAAARTAAIEAAAAVESVAGVEKLPARMTALELSYGNYLNQIRSPNALHRVKMLNSGVAVVEKSILGHPTFIVPVGCSIRGQRGTWSDPSGAFIEMRRIVVDLAQNGSEKLAYWITDDDIQLAPPDWIGDYWNEEYAKFWYMRSASGDLNVPECLIHQGIAAEFDVYDWNTTNPIIRAGYGTVVEPDDGDLLPTMTRSWKVSQYPIEVSGSAIASSESSDWNAEWDDPTYVHQH